MARQTILVYLSEESRAKGLLEVACGLARRQNSHLIAIYVEPPLITFPMMAELPTPFIDNHHRIYLECSKEIRAAFEETTRGDTFVAEWRMISAGAGPISDALMDHARCADLVVAPHYNSDYECEELYRRIAEDLAVDTGRPVIMVPENAKLDHVGEHITIAWDGSRESARAVFDSIELLQNAKKVHLLSVTDDVSIGSHAKLPGAEMAATLARRGVSCEIDQINPSELSTGDAILARVQDRGSDLLVMGIYGHSKPREFVFGGATRSVIKHMTVPVLMSC